MLSKEHKAKHKKKLFGRKKIRALNAKNLNIINHIYPKYKFKINDNSINLDQIKKTELEIGFGSGEHLIYQSINNRNTDFIGAEPFLNGITKTIEEIERYKLKNIKIYNGDAMDLIAKLSDETLSTIYILFPDPWPKKRHQKRRLVNPQNLREFHRVLKKGGRLYIASDHPDYQYHILMNTINDSEFIWICNKDEDFKKKPYFYPETRYESKAIENKALPIYLNFQKE
tara:strand:- start:65154 stop:65837 length:684 start_codon:yes stop_codon:yes gene_type:complete